MFFAMFERKKERLTTLYDTPRLPRHVWEQFRASTAAHGDPWIDVLRDYMETYVREREEGASGQP